MERTQSIPKCSFKSMPHPEHQAIIAECEPWVMDLIAAPTAAAAQYWKDNKLPVLGSWMFAGLPDKNRALLAGKMMIWFTVSDSADDDIAVRGCAGMDHLMRRHDLILAYGTGKPHNEYYSPGGANITREFSMLQDIWKDICKDMPLTMQSRYREAVSRYLHANRVQAQYRNTDSLPSVDDYLYVLRRPASICLQLLILIEYGLGIELDEETLSSKLVLRLHDAAVGHVALNNDFFSHEAEIFSGDHFNLPSVIFREGKSAQPGFTWADAVQQAMMMAEEVDKLAAQLIEEVKKSNLIKKPGMEAYLRALGLFMAGNYEWSQKTARYTHTCSKEGVVLPIKRTLSLPTSSAAPPLPPPRKALRVTSKHKSVSRFTVHVQNHSMRFLPSLHVPRISSTIGLIPLRL